ncbi:thioredoxin [Isobaculum melis]|uniref:Thioredoxin n=1 Tax=Isobaculum melis TaxID=142588 RepID=A0A1H9RKB8_9LACT|nr:thioredoxin [Isobaculum melis]SER72493.1 thioredoxin [Isobaculum melis]
MVQAITDANFMEETKSGLVITDFWAAWCGPCRMQAPVLEELAEEVGDTVKITKMDIEENPQTPAEFGIMSIPTLLIKKDGEVVETLVGFHQKEQLEAVIAKHA